MEGMDKGFDFPPVVRQKQLLPMPGRENAKPDIQLLRLSFSLEVRYTHGPQRESSGSLCAFGSRSNRVLGHRDARSAFP